MAIAATIKAVATGVSQPDGSVPSAIGANTAHIAAAAALGDGLSSIAVWLIQVFAHVSPPAAVETGITAVCVFIASLVMKKFGS